MTPLHPLFGPALAVALAFVVLLAYWLGMLHGRAARYREKDAEIEALKAHRDALVAVLESIALEGMALGDIAKEVPPSNLPGRPDLGGRCERGRQETWEFFKALQRANARYVDEDGGEAWPR
jgi:hypothetical protein